MGDLLEMQNLLSPLGCLHSRLVLCPFYPRPHMPRSLCGSSSRGLFLAPFKLWLSHGMWYVVARTWVSSRGLVTAQQPSRPERILQTSSIMHSMSAYYQAYTLVFPYVIYSISSLFELRKVP